MITNLESAEKVAALARSRRKPLDFKLIHKADRDEYEAQGWKLDKRNKKSYRMSRPKPKASLLEDRVWAALFLMGFDQMSGKGGARLALKQGEPSPVDNQIDVVALDPEVALAVECKSAASSRKEPRLQDYLAKLSVMRTRFAQGVQEAFPQEKKRVPVMVMWTWDIQITEAERARAAEQQVVLMDERDLVYYEELANHLGHAAKYQFFADLMPGKRVAGLERSVPALKNRMGKKDCYTFSISPEYLLKIAYVARRARGRATDIETYQRMIRKSRLKEIAKYIEEGGVFPTNIVVSLKGKKCARFDKGSGSGITEGAAYGTLHLSPAYGSAWVIDGQHRLYAYSGLSNAASGHLSVLAFIDLDASTQTKLFMDINSEQRRVPRNLLQELYADLFWYEEDEELRLQAILARAIKVLADDSDSPFRDRVLFEGDRRTRANRTRCLTHNGMYDALDQKSMYILKREVSYGPLWGADNSQTLARTVAVFKAWFSAIRDGATSWWDAGNDVGGGLAMNDSVVGLSMVLDRVLQHLSKSSGANLVELGSDELTGMVTPYATKLAEFLDGMSDAERKAYRSLRGVQGHTNIRRMCEIDLHDSFAEYDPPDLREQIDANRAGTREKAYPIVTRIEDRLYQHVTGILKARFGETDDAWWWQVPEDVRKRTTQNWDSDQGAKGGRENYLTLLDLRKIIIKNWDLFGWRLGVGKGGKKDDLTHWVEEVNDVRQIVAHAVKQLGVSIVQLDRMQEISDWLDGQLSLAEPPR
jgi:DGQHR domain-containing protein